jgi:hypothetical protein
MAAKFRLLGTICFRCCVVPFVVTAAAVPAHVPVVRGGLIRLRPEGVVSGLSGGLCGRGRLQGASENRGCRDQQKKTETLFHEGCSGR